MTYSGTLAWPVAYTLRPARSAKDVIELSLETTCSTPSVLSASSCTLPLVFL